MRSRQKLHTLAQLLLFSQPKPGKTTKMKRIATALVSLSIFLSYATAQNPVSWAFSLEDNGNGEISLIAKATIEPGWHLYDTEIPEGGPTPTTLTIDKLKGAEPIGKFHAEGTKPHVAFDPVFGMHIGTFDGQSDLSTFQDYRQSRICA